MIEVNNLTTNSVDEDFLKKTATIVLEGENKPSDSFAVGRAKKKLELSIVLVGQERIKELNKKYRGKNRVTDVLSFQYDDSGEIVICLREVKKNAKKDGLSCEKELVLVLIHGILHILGYSHERSEKEAKKMEEKQEHYLSRI
ncbi:MAG: rRNA maturation RNase YbeY [bacterium]